MLVITIFVRREAIYAITAGRNAPDFTPHAKIHAHRAGRSNNHYAGSNNHYLVATFDFNY